MTHTTNIELVEIAQQIATAVAQRQEVLAEDRMPTYWDTGTAADKLVLSLDKEIVRLCDKLRSACLKANKIDVPAQPGERIVPLAVKPEWRPMESGNE